VLELVFDPLAGVFVHAAVQEGEALATQSPGLQELLEVELGGPVLGEEDDPFCVPGPDPLRPIGAAGLFDPVEQAEGLGIGPAAVGRRPGCHPAEQLFFFVAEVAERRGGHGEGLFFDGLRLVLVVEVLVQAVEEPPSVGAHRTPRRLCERLSVHVEGRGERRR
jgi:hypothetical protein